MSSTFRHLKKIPMKYPFAFGMGISTVKTSASDLLVQVVVEQKEQIDWKRNAAFTTFGCFYLGGVQYAIYVPIFGRMFPNAASFAAKSIKEKIRDTKGQLAMLAQVFIDQCIHHPIMYFPVFYLTKELVTNTDKPDVKRAMATYKENMKEDMLALWKVWVPATIINFSFMPMWARIPMVSATSMLWTCILSAMRGGDVVHSDDMALGSIRGASFKIMKEEIGSLFDSPVELNPKLSHICVSAAGPDKVGWVSLLASAVSQEGGNITHSNMIRLGHDFIILMHVAIPPEKVISLMTQLKNNEELEPLNIRTSSLSRRQTGKYQSVQTGLRIHCVGPDRPGMLAAVANKVSQENLSVENITTELRTDLSGSRNFIINCDCSCTHKMTKEQLDNLFEDFNVLKDELNFDTVDVRVHMNPSST